MVRATLKIVCYITILAIASIIGIVLIRTVLVQPPSHVLELIEYAQEDGLHESITTDEEMIGRFQSALKFKTVSYDRETREVDELLQFGDFLVESYPTLNTATYVSRERIANYSLLYTIKGTDDNLIPYLLLAHLDVVPADSKLWDHEPFSGKDTGSYIYGRGSIDFKQGVMGIIEAVEYKLKKYGQPKRSFFISFGHDEEVSGKQGAMPIGKLLQSRGVKLAYIIDEGLTVARNIVKGVDEPMAFVGTTEKGYLTIRMSVEMKGGHSSMPKLPGAIGVISQAVAKLEENPLPSMLGSGQEVETYITLSSFMSPLMKVVMRNLWLFSPLVSRIASQTPATNAMLRTTTAVTMINGGVKENVLPQKAWAIVNHRIHPKQTVEEVLAYDKAIVNNPLVKFEVLEAMEAHPISSTQTFGFHCISHAILEAFPTVAAVAPGVMIGNTDTRHYLNLTSNIYRFSPTYNKPEDLARFHGNNERISKQNYAQAVNFYYRLMLYSDLPSLKDLKERSHSEL